MPNARDYQPRPDTGIFPTFFMSGFECSTFVWKDSQRKNYIALTGHERQLEQDYQRVKGLGIGVVREGIPWPLVDLGNGKYDWTRTKRAVEAAKKNRLTIIWDLCHYGFPDGCNPLDSDCLERFVEYCRAAARIVADTADNPHFFTPINEITFLAGACTDMGWMYPFAAGRYEEMKLALCRMDIAGATAIREIDSETRMVHVDPLIYEVAAPGHPEMERTAEEDTYRKTFEAWDILGGRLHPELGGKPEILDIVGVNIYSYCQAQLNADDTRTALGPRDPRRKPLSEMLRSAWDRYQRPIIIGETSGSGDERPAWLDMVMRESLAALNDGIDLQGICLFPCVDMPDWQTGKWARIGMFDVRDKETLERIPDEPYIAELRRWQQTLGRMGQVNGQNPSDDRVPLSEVRELARAWEEQRKQNQQAA